MIPQMLRDRSHLLCDSKKWGKCPWRVTLHSNGAGWSEGQYQHEQWSQPIDYNKCATSHRLILLCALCVGWSTLAFMLGRAPLRANLGVPADLAIWSSLHDSNSSLMAEPAALKFFRKTRTSGSTFLFASCAPCVWRGSVTRMVQSATIGQRPSWICSSPDTMEVVANLPKKRLIAAV